MDISGSINPVATSSSSSATAQHLDQHPSSSSISSTEPKVIRSSARVKAAKEKAKDKGKAPERDSTLTEQQTSASAHILSESDATETNGKTTRTKRPRESSSAKGKGKEVVFDEPARATRRTRRSSPSRSRALTINEPVPDRKGKKRAAPEPPSDDEAPSAKRPRTSSYSLRSQTKNISPAMPKKSRPSNAKGKMAVKAKAIAVASSSRLADEDIEMLDETYKNDISEPESPVDEQMNEEGDHDKEKKEGDAAQAGGEEDDEDEEEAGATGSNDAAPSDIPAPPGGLDDASALSIFGDYRQFGSYMLSLSSRLKTILNNIKPTADPTTRLVTLQELSELLSISTEDTLAGSFQVEQFVKELVKILGGRGINEDEDEKGQSK